MIEVVGRRGAKDHRFLVPSEYAAPSGGDIRQKADRPRRARDIDSVQMTADDLRLLRKSFTLVEATGHVGALIFYQRLFSVAPAVRPLFRTEIEVQSKKLMKTLTAVLGLAEKPEQFRETLEELGARHVEYGAKPEHYPIVVETLLYMLERVLRDSFTPKVQELWKGLLDTIAGMMLQGAETAARRASARPAF